MHSDEMTRFTLPSNFNPDTCMIANETEFGRFHESRRAARLAKDLLATGHADDIALAHDVLRAVLACQERDARDPHVGNFYWMREDDQVEDLNAVEFVLEALIPLMQHHAHLLDPDLRTAVLDAIRLGLDEVRRLDVLVAYTNITALDVLNTCLGGELLGDAGLAQRGYAKLAAWMAFTAAAGHPLEYNSPTYTAVTLRALKELRDNVRDEATQQRATAFAARLALSVALHNHAGTGRWAGPHSRAYQPTIVGETPPEIEQLQDWIATGIVPPWIEEFLANRTDGAEAGFTVTETASRQFDLSFSTYHAPAFALGIASRNFNDQNNVCIAHYRRPGSARPGVFYTRYLLDDKWFGDIYHRTDRSKTRNLPDEGTFFGVQDGSRALCVYALTRAGGFESAKAALIWTGLDAIDTLVVGGEAHAPAQLAASADGISVAPGDTVVVASGDVFMAVRPLTVTRLCKEPPRQVVARGGDLVLELFNYRGVFKRFWELGWPGAFFQGHPLCAFLLETAPRTAFADAAAFARHVAAIPVDETLDLPFTYAGETGRRYRVEAGAGEQRMGLEVDVMTAQLRERWTSQGDPGWPMLDSPFAREAADGRVTLGDTTLTCDPGPAWLARLPHGGGYVAGYTGLTPTTLTLTAPEGRVEVQELGPGVVVWRPEQPGTSRVTIDGAHGAVARA